MSPRVKMMAELDSINDKIELMTDRVQKSIVDVIDALKNKNIPLAKAIIDMGDEIDDLEEEIQDDCFRFLATQAPIGSDLRYCVSVMKMVRDLERIGDHCEDLAKFAIRLEKLEYREELVDLPRMADLAAKMVQNATHSFINRDLRLARKVWKGDEEVDELFKLIYEEEMDIAAQQDSNPRISIYFIFIAAHLERIGDYATNICEETIFSMEGERI